MKAVSRVSKMLMVMFVFVCLSAAPMVVAGGAADKVEVRTEQYSPDQPEYYIQVAKQEMNEGRYWAAEKALKKAKRMDPEKAEAYRLLGDIHSTFDRDWKAEKFYKKADELDSKARHQR